MNAAARLRFEARLRHRLSEECFDLASVQWRGEGPGPDYAMVRIIRGDAVLGIGVSALVIERYLEPRALIDELVRQVVDEYQHFNRGDRMTAPP